MTLSGLYLSNLVPDSPTEAPPNSHFLFLGAAEVSSHYIPADSHTALVRKGNLSKHVDYWERALLLSFANVELKDFDKGVGRNCE
jgi:hypothetical protein